MTEFKRLTHRKKEGLLERVELPGAVSFAIERLAAYEDTGLTPEEVAELARAKDRGRLVTLHDCDRCENKGFYDECSCCIHRDTDLYDNYRPSLAVKEGGRHDVSTV